MSTSARPRGSATLANAVRLAPIRNLRGRDALSDPDMVKIQRANLLDPGAPNPSVETLLHAFLPHKFIDHTHATAVLSLADQPDAAERCADLYGPRVGIVPYIMPGLLLAKKAAEVFEADPAVEGLVLLKHGVKNVCVHKGLPGLFLEQYCHSDDLARAAAAFPDLNFIAFHSAFPW